MVVSQTGQTTRMVKETCERIAPAGGQIAYVFAEIPFLVNITFVNGMYMITDCIVVVSNPSIS